MNCEFIESNKECPNKAEFSVVLTSEFNNDLCYWCSECVQTGIGMVESILRIREEV